MAHKQVGLWREKETDKLKPKMCPKCLSKKLHFIQSYANDDDEIDDETARAWAIEWGNNPKDAWDDSRFAYYEDHYECRRCGHYAEWGPRHYFNPETINYDCDLPLMPDTAKRAELEHERQQALAAGQLPLL